MRLLGGNFRQSQSDHKTLSDLSHGSSQIHHIQCTNCSRACPSIFEQPRFRLRISPIMVCPGLPIVPSSRAHSTTDLPNLSDRQNSSHVKRTRSCDACDSILPTTMCETDLQRLILSKVAPAYTFRAKYLPVIPLCNRPNFRQTVRSIQSEILAKICSPLVANSEFLAATSSRINFLANRFIAKQKQTVQTLQFYHTKKLRKRDTSQEQSYISEQQRHTHLAMYGISPFDLGPKQITRIYSLLKLHCFSLTLTFRRPGFSSVHPSQS